MVTVKVRQNPLIPIAARNCAAPLRPSRGRFGRCRRPCRSLAPGGPRERKVTTHDGMVISNCDIRLRYLGSIFRGPITGVTNRTQISRGHGTRWRREGSWGRISLAVLARCGRASKPIFRAPGSRLHCTECSLRLLIVLKRYANAQVDHHPFLF